MGGDHGRADGAERDAAPRIDSWIAGAPAGRMFSDHVARALRSADAASPPRLRARAAELAREDRRGAAPKAAVDLIRLRAERAPASAARRRRRLRRPAPSVVYAALAACGAAAALAAVIANAPPTLPLVTSARPLAAIEDSLSTPVAVSAERRDETGGAALSEAAERAARAALGGNRAVGELISLRLDPRSAPGARTLDGEAWFALAPRECARRALSFGAASAADGAPALTLSRVGPMRPAACADAPAMALPTDSIGAYLTAADLEALLADRPRKCVFAPGEAASAGRDCVETTLYQPETGLFTRGNRLNAAARLEVGAAYGLEGDALCHYTPGLTARVIGATADGEQAMDLERRVEAYYRSQAAAKLCHRLRRAGVVDGRETFVADVFIDGAATPRRFDPRRFEMLPAR